MRDRGARPRPPPLWKQPRRDRRDRARRSSARRLRRRLRARPTGPSDGPGAGEARADANRLALGARERPMTLAPRPS